jgi:hypothetical protein
VIRQLIYFCGWTQSALCVVMLPFCLKIWPQSKLRYLLKAGLVFWILCIFVVTDQPAIVQGQAIASTEASADNAEVINPQYEDNVKAAFLYSFGRYVEWPIETFTSQSSEFIIGIMGDDSIRAVIDRIAQSKTIQGHRIVVHRIASLEDIPRCHILFISNELQQEQQSAIINKVRNSSTLLVGETPKFAEHGGGINFYIEKGAIKFEINIDAIRREKLVLDAKLLNLGRKISEIR